MDRMSPAQPTRRRSDAVANRVALLDAAEQVLLRDGPGAPLDVVAREAGVGIATLYRNFADREELCAAVVHRSYELLAALAGEAEHSTARPLDALAGFFDRLMEERRHLALPLLGTPGPLPGQGDPLGPQITRSLTEVLNRGIDDGSVRPDATATDLIVTGAMLAHAQLPADDWDRAARRIVALLLDGLRARPDTPRLPAGLTRGQLDQAMTRTPTDRATD